MTSIVAFIKWHAVLTYFALALGLSGAPVQAMPTPDRTAYDAIDVYLTGQMQRLQIPGAALAIVEGDQIVHLRGFGQARPGGAPPSPQTPFVIGSTTKSFTALAVMQLVEAGKIELDAPVQRYLPWFRVADPQASAQITVRHLMHQTSGLPASAGEIQMVDFDVRPDAAERQARALATRELSHPIGTTFEYSNANYNLLGLILEVASGESYGNYIQRHILQPLAMRHSYTTAAAARQNGLAIGHRYWFTMPVATPEMPIPQGSLPSGQLISSAEDMAHYMIALLNGGRYQGETILSAAGVSELHRGAADVSTMGISLGKYGMGWVVDTIGGSRLLWHSGTNPDFAAYMALLPEQGKGVVLLFNASHHWMNPVLSTFGNDVAALLAGEPPTSVPFVGLIPWLLRGQLLIPAFLLVDVAATLWLVRRWRREPTRRPSGWGVWGWGLLLPLIPTLLIALTLLPMLGETRGYLQLYMPDYAWIATVCGSFAVVWSVVRTGLVLRRLRTPRSSEPVIGRLSTQH